MQADTPNKLSPSETLASEDGVKAEWRRVKAAGALIIVSFIVVLLALVFADPFKPLFGSTSDPSPTGGSPTKAPSSIAPTPTQSPSPEGLQEQPPLSDADRASGHLSTSGATFVGALAGQIATQLSSVAGASLTQAVQTGGELKTFLLERVAGPFAEELSRKAGERIIDVAADYLTAEDNASDSTGRLRVCVALAEELHRQIAADMRGGRYGPVGSDKEITITAGEAADRLAGALCGQLVSATDSAVPTTRDPSSVDVMNRVRTAIREVGHDLRSPGDACPQGFIQTDSHEVHPGDNLWLIARRLLPMNASNQAVDRLWRQIYTKNHRVVGADPDLIHPGDLLDLPCTHAR